MGAHTSGVFEKILISRSRFFLLGKSKELKWQKNNEKICDCVKKNDVTYLEMKKKEIAKFRSQSFIFSSVS